jgi:hypothetical protein
MSIYRAPPPPSAGLPPTNTRNYMPDMLHGNTLGGWESSLYRQQAPVRSGEPSRRVVQLRIDRRASVNVAGVTVCDLDDACQR